MEYNPQYYKICLASKNEEELLKKCLVYLGIEYYLSNKEYTILIDSEDWYIITESKTEEINKFVNDWLFNEYDLDKFNVNEYLLLAQCLIFGLI